MPFLVSMFRRYVFAAVALPLAARGLAALGRRVEASRGPGTLSSTLQGGSRLISRQKGEQKSRGRRGFLRRRG